MTMAFSVHVITDTVVARTFLPATRAERSRWTNLWKKLKKNSYHGCKDHLSLRTTKSMSKQCYRASGWVEKQLSSGKLQKHHWYFVLFVFIFWSRSHCSCRGSDLKSYTSSQWSITRCCRYTPCFSPLNLDSSPLVSLLFQKSTREARERCA